MSVPEGKRKKTSLELFVKAQQLSAYTIQITSNTKTFPVEYADKITNKIVDAAIEIYAKSWEANNVRVNDKHDNWIVRRDLQRESIRLCDTLLVYIGIAKGVFHIRDKRIKYWTGKVLEVKTMLSAWHKNDVDRYGHL